VYSAALGNVAGGGVLASNGDTTATVNHNVTANAGGDKSALHLAIAVVVVGIVLLLIGRGVLRNARIV
jgi:hypothetical protein